MRYELLLAGAGGQGIILAGTVIGTAGAVYQGLNAAQISSYGPEARGGHVFTEVVLSDEEIHYSGVREPDILVAMSQWAYNEFHGKVRPGGLIIYDPELVKPEPRPEGVRLLPVRATRMAEEKVGLKLSANMVMVGVLTALCDLLDREAVEKAIRYRVRRALDKNLEAFRLGYELGLKLKSSLKGF
ncbi:hypothetical protein B6U66_01435 [Candidatus Bathyarchaeota archaeon ex4484_135]|nr:MAG: hypothetical protein B6U66_01435 [Candidatus Bathyarchaeota archaeon ex4484_135]